LFKDSIEYIIINITKECLLLSEESSPETAR